MSGKQDKLIGKAKETVGKLTDNRELAAEGRAQYAKGEVKDNLGKASNIVEATVEGVEDRGDRHRDR